VLLGRVNELTRHRADLRGRLLLCFSQRSHALTPTLRLAWSFLAGAKLRALLCVSPNRGIRRFCFGGAAKAARGVFCQPSTTVDGRKIQLGGSLTRLPGRQRQSPRDVDPYSQELPLGLFLDAEPAPGFRPLQSPRPSSSWRSARARKQYFGPGRSGYLISESNAATNRSHDRFDRNIIVSDRTR
jgi:hypothetical protein